MFSVSTGKNIDSGNKAKKNLSAIVGFDHMEQNKMQTCSLLRA